MSGRNIVGVLLIAAGVYLIFLRARQKGDIKLTSEGGGLWPVIGQVGDGVYIAGLIMIVIGAFLIDPNIVDLINGEGGDDGATTSLRFPVLA